METQREEISVTQNSGSTDNEMKVLTGGVQREGIDPRSSVSDVETGGITWLRSAPWEKSQSENNAVKGRINVTCGQYRIRMMKSQRKAATIPIAWERKHNTTPTTEHGLSPLQRLLQYSPRTLLHVLNPNTKEVPVRHRKLKEVPENAGGSEGRNASSKKPFMKGDQVLYYTGEEWIKGCVVKRISKVVYTINVDGATIKCHRDQLKKYHRRWIIPDVPDRNDEVNENTSEHSSEDDVFYSPMKSTPEVPLPRRSARLRDKPRINYKE
ncbi:uncharacterized protein LOC129789447 [Lutzomyia longipalpis]|uniref:uncharacterized protein LOC129789447 n=1 Tax=Lutzomyia longipalpis TaxID=7200 RepID=UPI00248466BA|nr:uncharacterized protein LOC129789447 [Lutzomyia longipalpis]